MTDEFKQINDKLDYISQKVSVEPTWWDKWGDRIKYTAVGLAWIIGVVTHKYGLYHFLSQLTN